jgi:ABC-type dipeptide/oligopeptide/nickel transport system permease component
MTAAAIQLQSNHILSAVGRKSAVAVVKLQRLAKWKRRRILLRQIRGGSSKFRRLVLGRHVLRNALISTVALFGLNIGTLFGGAVITETVFAIPGVGRLLIDSIYGRDYPVIQGLTLVLAILVCLVFLVTDLVQAWLDPRVGRS